MRYQNGEYQPQFPTLDDCIKDLLWRDTRKIRILGQEYTLEAGEDPPTPTKIPYQLPTNLEKLDKDVVGDELTR